MGFFNKNDQKQFTLSEEQHSELGFFARMKKEKELEYNMWDNQMTNVMVEILMKLGLKPNEWTVDWPRVIREGKLVATRIPQPKVEVGPEERKPEVKNGTNKKH